MISNPKAKSTYALLNQSSMTEKRVSEEFFSKDGRILVPHTHLVIPMGPTLAEENAYIREQCERGHWSRTRYSDKVVYLFEDEIDALAMKMRFG